MLLNDFFILESFTFTFEDELSAHIQLNPDHDIFYGHFPGQPVVPGVCMLQMVKEVLEKALGHQFFLRKASNIKFLTFIDPQQHSHIQLFLKILSHEKEMKVRASLYEKEQVFFKFSGSFER